MYKTETNLPINRRVSVSMSLGKRDSLNSNFSLGGDLIKNPNMSIRSDCTTSFFLRKLRNLTVLKFKLDETVKLMPEILKKLINQKIKDKDIKQKAAESLKYCTSANIEDIDLENMKFIPIKRRTKKKDKFTSKLNEIYSFDKPPIEEEEMNRDKNKKRNQDYLRNEEKYSIKEFNKNYSIELERLFEEIFSRNELLNLKLFYYKQKDEEYTKLLKEMANFKIFKKLLTKKGKNIENVEFYNKDDNKTSCLNKFYCENPECVSSNLNYVEMKREYDQLLVQNFHIKKLYFDLKFQKNQIKSNIKNS